MSDEEESESESEEEEMDVVESVQESNNIQSIISEHAVVAAIEMDDAKGMSCIEMSKSIFDDVPKRNGHGTPKKKTTTEEEDDTEEDDTEEDDTEEDDAEEDDAKEEKSNDGYSTQNSTRSKETNALNNGSAEEHRSLSDVTKKRKDDKAGGTDVCSQAYSIEAKVSIIIIYVFVLFSKKK